jgi:hypothetical protein
MFLGYTYRDNYGEIPCASTKTLGSLTYRTVAILPRHDENITFSIDFNAEKILDFSTRKYFLSWMVGCIQYKWPATDKIFHTYFRVLVEIINSKTGDRIPPYAKLEPFTDYSFRPAAGISYIDAD